jgi:hypothetical protein
MVFFTEPQDKLLKMKFADFYSFQFGVFTSEALYLEDFN